MRSRWLLSSISILACAAVLVFVACSASKQPSRANKRRTVLLTEYDDARVGSEASSEVAAQLGLLDDPALNAYVSELGRKLLRGVPRRSFDYQFSVVDQFEPNAFALPGGYIFVSRGLLGLANTEDELANVIGHEITHAARRHAASQQALSRHMNPLSIGYVRAAQLAAYGRDMEREADRGGQLLAAAAGYDPMGMATFLTSMGQMERLLIGHARLPTFFDTHPGSQERAASNATRTHEMRWKRNPALGDTRASYLRRIDGLALDQRPEAGIFQGDRFLHPDMDFTVRFPAGWETQNSNQAVGATSPRRDAVVFLTADQPEGDPKQMAETFLAKTQEEQPVTLKESQPVKIGRLDAWRMKLEAGGRGGSVSVYLIFFPYRGATWRITGMSASHVGGRYTGPILNTARSFRPLTDEDRSSIRSARLRIVTARPGESLTALGQRTDNAWDPSRTAVYNGLFSNHRFEGGELVKIARVEPYFPPTR